MDEKMYDRFDKAMLVDFAEVCNQRYPKVAEFMGFYTGSEFSGYDEVSVYFSGHEYWSKGGHEYHQNALDWQWFLVTDKEFDEMMSVEVEKIAKREGEKKLAEALAEERALAEKELKDRELYKELKAKYGESL